MHSKETLITAGGQAVIEGVMMRSQNKLAVAVRKSSGKIHVKKQTIKPWSKRHKLLCFLDWPIIRGIARLIEMLVIGIKALNYSANAALEEDDDDISTLQMIMSLALALVFAVVLFKLLPLLIAQFFNNRVEFIQSHYVIFNLIDGITKIFLFILYIIAISFMKDVKTLFEYHGAEHSVVNCYEAGKKLTWKNISRYTTLHPRCGTSFLLIVLIISILIYTLIPKDVSFAWKLMLRLALLPLIAGISYEILRLAGKYRQSILLKIIVFPGMMVQKLTTRKPSRKQVEVAIAALKGVVRV